MMKEPTVIFRSNRYRIVSWGNGMAYEIWRLSDNASVYIQGGDVTEFRSELNGEFDRDVSSSAVDRVDDLCSDYDEVMQAP